MNMGKKLIAVIEILETRAGLKKDDAASLQHMGDGLFKMKVGPNDDPVIQIEGLSHEWMHFLLSVFKAKKGGKKLRDKEEEDICEEIGITIRNLFRKHFREKK